MFDCPVPKADDKKILLAHGSGGTLMNGLIEKVFRSAFDNDILRQEHDSAVFSIGKNRCAMTTDSYVVDPIFFPGGNIGSLAVHGTVNDLLMAGATPLFLSAAVILEEGFSVEALMRITESLARAAQESKVAIVTGDTKVVEKGKGDGIFINTTGIGILEHDQAISSAAVRPGDAVFVSGDIGRHGIAILAQREGLQFENVIESDSASLRDLVLPVLKEGIEIHCMRDLTRGGLASALNEIARQSHTGVLVLENQVPVNEQVRGACEVLGLDPLYVANEGRCVFFVPGSASDQFAGFLKKNVLGTGAQRIGTVTEQSPGQVIVQSVLGTQRVLDMLSGDQLPRIC